MEGKEKDIIEMPEEDKIEEKMVKKDEENRRS